MSDSEHFRITSQGSLVMFNVSKSDEGRYECVADNGRDKRTISALFSIRGGVRINQSRRRIISTTTSRPQLSGYSYEARAPTIGDGFVLVALEEATNSVDRALNATVQGIFNRREQNVSVTPADLVRIFRYCDILINT